MHLFWCVHTSPRVTHFPTRIPDAGLMHNRPPKDRDPCVQVLKPTDRAAA